MANALPADALGPETLAEMYKDLKDNRNVNQELIQLIYGQVMKGQRCHVEDFLNAITCADSLIIGFYRKFTKLRPNKFIK